MGKRMASLRLQHGKPDDKSNRSAREDAEEFAGGLPEVQATPEEEFGAPSEEAGAPFQAPPLPTIDDNRELIALKLKKKQQEEQQKKLEEDAAAAQDEIKKLEDNLCDAAATEREAEKAFKALSTSARMKARDMIGDIFWANATWAARLAAAQEGEEELKDKDKEKKEKKEKKKEKSKAKAGDEE